MSVKSCRIVSEAISPLQLGITLHPLPDGEIRDSKRSKPGCGGGLARVHR